MYKWKKELKFGQKEGECFLMENWQIEYCDLTGTGNHFNVELGPGGERCGRLSYCLQVFPGTGTIGSSVTR